MKTVTLFICSGLLLLSAMSINVWPTSAGSVGAPFQTALAIRKGAPPLTAPPALVVDARDGLLFGGFAGGRWLAADRAKRFLKDGETYRLYTLMESLGTGSLSKHAPEEDGHSDCSGADVVKISPLTEGDNDVIGINGNWNAQPRLPKVQSADQQVYRELVNNFLKGVGINGAEIKIGQILRVDLEGDGTEEVLILADSGGMYMGKGSYSLALLRKVVQGKTETIPLNVQYLNKEPKSQRSEDLGELIHNTASAFLDINGDGVMEIILSYQILHGAGKEIYEVKGRRAKKVLEAGCYGD